MSDKMIGPPQHDAPFDWDQAKKDGLVWLNHFEDWAIISKEDVIDPFPHGETVFYPVTFRGVRYFMPPAALRNKTNPRKPVRPEPQVLSVYAYAVDQNIFVTEKENAPPSQEEYGESHKIPFGCRDEGEMILCNTHIRCHGPGQFAVYYKGVVIPSQLWLPTRADAVVAAEKYIRDYLEG